MFKPTALAKCKRPLGIERLEARQMMATDVFTFVDADGLHIKERIAGSANSVEISTVEPNIVRITGKTKHDGSGGVSSVNGHPFVDIAHIGKVFVDLKGGPDLVILNELKRTSKVFINTAGPGVDTDTVIVGEGVRLSLGLDIQTGAGADNVLVFGARIGNDLPFADLSIKTGAGADSVFIGPNAVTLKRPEVLGNLIVRTHGAVSENDADTVFMQSVLVHKNTSVTMGGGDDTLTMFAFNSEDVFISADGGNDTVKLRDVEARDDFFAFMGAGNDRLEALFVLGDEAKLEGGDGLDSLTNALDTSFRKLTQSGWEVINGRLILNVDPGDLVLTQT